MKLFTHLATGYREELVYSKYQMLPTPEKLILEDLVRLRFLGAEARPAVEPIAEPEDSDNRDASHYGTALHRSMKKP